MNTPDDPTSPETFLTETDDRREFVRKLGRFAVITSPAVTMLLSTSMSSAAVATSGGSAPPVEPIGEAS